jgi:CBS domain
LGDGTAFASILHGATVHAGIEMTVADVMTRNPVTVSVRHSLSSALQTIRARRVSVLPVVEGDELVGLLTARDTCWNLSDLEYREVGAEMDPHPAYVRPDSNLREAAFMLLSQERPGLLTIPQGGGLALAEISSLIRAQGGDLLTTIRESIAGPAPAYRLRVSTPDPDALVALLEARGHRVVISTTKREGGAARSSGAMRCC